MRRLLVILMAMGLFGTMPAFAGHGEMKIEHEGVRQCALQAESIQEKIKRLESEVAKGEKKYDVNQLKALEKKLKEANELLEMLNRN